MSPSPASFVAFAATPVACACFVSRSWSVVFVVKQETSVLRFVHSDRGKISLHRRFVSWSLRRIQRNLKFALCFPAVGLCCIGRRFTWRQPLRNNSLSLGGHEERRESMNQTSGSAGFSAVTMRKTSCAMRFFLGPNEQTSKRWSLMRRNQISYRM